MFVIDEIVVATGISQVQFACDLGECKGACCTMEGAGGAPLENEEVEIIEQVIPTVIKYLAKRHQNQLASRSFFSGEEDSYVVESVNDRDCVFSYKEKGVAKCSFEKAYFNGEITFRKPISCQLFPIRIRDFGGPILHYEKISECKPAVQRGKKERIFLSDFLRDALIRKYGEPWYNSFRKACEAEQLSPTTPQAK